ncbi:MAG: hypothetical protein HC877_11040 [Thioploca sp.]|nr:hypothetical protein [Thioploca sp.]
MEPLQIKELILKELPTLIQQDSSLREWVLTIGRTQFAEQTATESRFDQMMRIIFLPPYSLSNAIKHK